MTAPNPVGLRLTENLSFGSPEDIPMAAPTLMDIIGYLKKQHPQADRIELTPELHELLCDELCQREGRPSRVYCVQGLRVIVSPPMEEAA